MTQLNTMKAGQSATVISLNGCSSFISRATAMGFIPDTHVTMLQNMGNGPLLVYMRDTQVALGRKEAVKIEICMEAKNHE